MCLVTNTPIPIILEKDLVVYKVLWKLGNRIYSIYQDHRYDIGKIYYEEEIGIEPNNIIGQEMPDGYCVYEAYHACTTLDRANYHIGEMRKCRLVISKGFKVFFDRGCDDIGEIRKYRIYKCVIPKGSKVFFDRGCDEIASDTIIIKRRLLFNRF